MRWGNKKRETPQKRRSVQQKEKQAADKKKQAEKERLLEQISPIGGIRHYETYSRTGTGYESCIHIYDFPATLNDYWLTKVCNQSNTVTSISIHTEDQVEVKKNLNKSIEEQNSRKAFAREYKDFYDAERREMEMRKLYEELQSMDEVVKSVVIRIFTVGKTLQELEDANARVIKSLEADMWRAAVFLNESAQEWRSVYRSAEKQMKEPHALPGLPLKATLLAAGNAFHFSSLEDPAGGFLGETACGGNVIFDGFTSNDIRVSYSAVVVGKQRFGKSTLLKLILKDRALRGDFTRTFDITGEFSTLTKRLGGKVLNMNGSDGIINLLEIFRSGDNEHTNYTRHLSKIKTSYRFLKPEATAEEIGTLVEVLDKLYGNWNLQPDRNGNKISGLSAKQYPTFSDLLDLISKEIETMIAKEYKQQERALVERKLLNLDNIRLQISQLVNAYGYLFNGHTSLDNMTDVRTVTYNLTEIKDLDPQIFDLQLYNILCICWDGAITNGALMKKLYEEGKTELEDVIHTLILIDESHRWVNARKLYALEALSQFLREGPKYFAGIWLASQSIRDYTPEGSTAEGVDTLKNIFGLTQYKFIFHQDDEAIPVLDKAFNNSLTYAQRERIPRLARGETILCISGDRNIQFKVYLSKRDERLFEGGV